MERELAGLEDQLARVSDRAEMNAEVALVLAKLSSERDIDALLAKLTEDKQACLFRLIFADVKIKTGGWAKTRTFELESYRNLLIEDITVISQCASA
jgi:hypothetical protein